MGLRLRLLYWWTPSWIVSRELDHVSKVTTAALKSLLDTHAESKQIQRAEAKVQHSKNVEEKRSLMAAEHARLVQELETAVGRGEALSRGREALFEVGRRLGIETREKLGASGDNPKDLVRAAIVLYRVLGIKFHIEWQDDSAATLIIDRCALAKEYSKLTCEVLSATDEGVMKGLQPSVTMKFKEYITSGCKNCRANIHFS